MYRISFHIKAALIVINFKINIENYVNVMMLLSSNSVQLHQHSNVLPCKQIFLLLFTFISSSVESLWMFWTQKKNFFSSFHVVKSPSSTKKWQKKCEILGWCHMISCRILIFYILHENVVHHVWLAFAWSSTYLLYIFIICWMSLGLTALNFCFCRLIALKKKRKLFCVRIINDDIDFIIVGISGWNMMKTSCFQV